MLRRAASTSPAAAVAQVALGLGSRSADDDRCAKPDARYYRIALAAIGLPVENLLFIDDNRRNILAAERLGLPSLLFTDAKALRRDLRARGFAIGE